MVMNIEFSFFFIFLTERVIIMIKMNLFNEEISNLDDLINVICENVLTSNYFIGDEHIVELDVNEIKSHLDEEELEDFEEFINRLF